MSLLNLLCYENITPNYCYAKFYNYKIIVHTSTGFFNATNLCENNNNNLKDWENLEHTQTLKKNLKNDWVPLQEYEISQTKVSGTYLHPVFITDIISWMDIRMYKKFNNNSIENALSEFKCTVKKDIGQKYFELCNLENISNKIPEYLSTSKNNCKKCCNIKKNYSNE